MSQTNIEPPFDPLSYLTEIAGQLRSSHWEAYLKFADIERELYAISLNRLRSQLHSTDTIGLGAHTTEAEEYQPDSTEPDGCNS